MQASSTQPRIAATAGNGRPQSQATVATVADWLRRLVDPDGVVELRALQVREGKWRPYTASGFFDYDHLDDMAKAALQLSGKATGVYWTLNPLDKDLLAKRCNRVDRAVHRGLANDDHVLRRRWFFIDTDPARPPGSSSSDTEKATAWDLVLAIRTYLRDFGWPDPILADSGNGYHLLFRIDLPRQDDGLVRRVLQALAKQFDNAKVKVDTSVHNPSRICKLYGTLSRKGDPTDERPHRPSAILEGLDSD